MKLIARVKLNASPETGVSLLQTMEAANMLCDWISQQAWQSKQFRRYDIHNAIYHTARQQTDLTSQMIVRCIAKVADSYRKDRDTLRTFKPHGAMAYDGRILSWEMDNQVVSIWTVNGRARISYSATDYLYVVKGNGTQQGFC
jgi:hypothetical protein